MKYLNALNKINGTGPQKMKMLLSFFGSFEKAWQASTEELMQSGIGEKLAEKIDRERKDINPDEEWAKLEKANIRMITWDSDEYPRLLREINNPPYILYIRGDFDLNSMPMISIVGSRKFTAYGSQVASTFARDLAQAGICVVSGMALGIDAIAHEGALSANGKTVAVLGDGLDDESIHPRNNFNLSRDIIENGALVSDFPVGTPPLEYNFPARNRIIAGLSLGTLVVEAGEKSGTLITASLALDFNREVFAVPGSVFSPQSFGTNDLIRKGAKVVTSVKDILEELNLEKGEISTKIIPKNFETLEEETIMKLLSTEPVHIDKIAKMSKLSVPQVSSQLSMMEIKGWIKNIGGQNYITI